MFPKAYFSRFWKQISGFPDSWIKWIKFEKEMNLTLVKRKCMPPFYQICSQFFTALRTHYILSPFPKQKKSPQKIQPIINSHLFSLLFPSLRRWVSITSNPDIQQHRQQQQPCDDTSFRRSPSSKSAPDSSWKSVLLFAYGMPPVLNIHYILGVSV